MIDMLTITSSEARKGWSSVMDTAVRQKPVLIRRTRDYMMLCSTSTISAMVADLKFEAISYQEQDGSITLSVQNLDIISNGQTLENAKHALVLDLMEYAEEYYAEFELYSKAPNRKAHLPYVMKILAAANPAELEGALICRDGKS